MKRSPLLASMCSFILIAVVYQPLAQDNLVPRFTWHNVAIGGGGFVSSVIADPNASGLFYARTDVGGAYRWDNMSSKWISMMDWVDVTERGLLGIEAIAVDPKISGKVYMVAGTSYWNNGRSAFLRSSDRGNNWEVIYTWDTDGTKGGAVSNFSAHGNGMGRGNGEALAIDPNNSNIMFYGSRNKGLFKSVNNGSTWSKVNGFTAAAGSDTTWNGSGFSFVTFAPNSSNVLYAGFLRSDKNVFQSVDGGATWSLIPNRIKPKTAGGYEPPLMPQRVAITPDGENLYITFGDGAGPHTMAWDEGWGPINDWFNRGAVLKYHVTSGTWTDISPENYIDPNGAQDNSPDAYAACYGGVSINPQNPNEIVVSSIGYMGPQFWKQPGTANSWSDQWGSNIYYTNDGGATWISSFKYYNLQGSDYPAAEQLNENGIGWMFNSSIHWSGSIAFDPFNPKRVWVTSGNGMFSTADITDFDYAPAQNAWDGPTVNQRTVWKVVSHGIEETVPTEVVSVPGGPLISVILDYDGFRHDDVTQYPSKRHQTNVSGSNVSLGSTRALAFAPKSGRLVKVTDARVYKAQYNDIQVSPLQFSNDTGRTWSVTTYQSGGPVDFDGAAGVAISTDGEVTLLTPSAIWDDIRKVHEEQQVWRYVNAAWSAVAGIDGSYVVGDPENADVFYAYNRGSGKMFKSADKGVTFSEVSTPGASGFQKFRLVPQKEGDIWIPLTENGLSRSVDGGASFSKIQSVSYCEAVGFGKAAEGKTFPTVFIFGTVGGRNGVFMSNDEGETWHRVNDDKHEYGGLANGEFVMGDMNVYGRVYMSTAGRGIVYGEYEGMGMSIGRGAGKANKLAGIIKIRGASISIKADSRVKHNVQIFDLKGRQLYKNIITGSQVVSVKKILPKGNYLVSIKRDGVEAYKGKLRIVR